MLFTFCLLDNSIFSLSVERWEDSATSFSEDKFQCVPSSCVCTYTSSILTTNRFPIFLSTLHMLVSASYFSCFVLMLVKKLLLVTVYANLAINFLFIDH